MWWWIYEWNHIYMNCGTGMKWIYDHRSGECQFKQLQFLSQKKNSAFNGIWINDLRVTSVLFYQLSYEATCWEQVNCEFIYPWYEWIMWWWIYEWNHIYMNCGNWMKWIYDHRSGECNLSMQLQFLSQKKKLWLLSQPRWSYIHFIKFLVSQS